MPDYGLISGLAQGLQSGLESYQSTRAMNLKEKRDKEEDERRKREYKLGLLKSGYNESPEGLLSKTDEQVFKEEEDKDLKRLGIQERAAAAGLEPVYGKDQKLASFKPGKDFRKGDPVTHELQMARLDDMKRRQEESKPQQAQSATFARRIEQAEESMKKLSDKGYNRADPQQGLMAYAPGMLQPENFKLQDQAERNFVNAVLRRESGAAISEDEFTNANKQYFPRAGDTADVLAQKEQNRKTVLAGLKSEAGHAYNNLLAQEKPTSSPGGFTANLRDVENAQAETKPRAKPDFRKMSKEELRKYTGK